MYPEVEYVIANYLSADVEYTEDEVVKYIRENLSDNPETATRYRLELCAALSDPNYSWKDAFSRFNAMPADTEEEARSYARRMLWERVLEP